MLRRRHRGVVVAFLCALSVVIAPVSARSQEAGESEIHALIVGISDYTSKFAHLPNAKADAVAFAASLKERVRKEDPTIGYYVDIRTAKDNTTRASLEDDWNDLIDDLDDDDTVIFYFSGHGLEIKGRNHLLTSDLNAEPNDPNKFVIKETSLDLDSLIEALGRAQARSKRIVGIFIVDACRRNPFTDWDKTMDTQVGLAAGSLPPDNIFIMYSAGIGQLASDGVAGQRSPFLQALLKALATDKLTLDQLAQRVRIDVYKETYQGRPQTPAYYDQLTIQRTITGKRPSLTIDNEQIPYVGGLAEGDILIECTLCPEMVVLPAHAYRMGSPESDTERRTDEGPLVTVAFPKKFAVSKHEITIEQWNDCVRDKGACPGEVRSEDPRDAGKPVTDVSLTDALAYVGWLNRVTPSKSYRLPSEAEWEYAARDAPDLSTPYAPFPFDQTKEKICQYANGADREAGAIAYAYAHCTDGVGRNVTQAKRYRPSKLGLHDMLGNVWEWTADCWHPRYEVTESDGSARGPKTGTECEMNVVRGGSWRSGLKALRPTARNAFPPDERRGTVGFRVVRDVP